MGSAKRPWLHRAMGYAYFTFMLLAAISSCFILDFKLPNWRGFTAIHLLIPVTLTSLWVAFRAIAKKRPRHAPHHHAMALCGGLPDRGWLYFAALTLFGQLGLA